MVSKQDYNFFKKALVGVYAKDNSNNVTFIFDPSKVRRGRGLFKSGVQLTIGLTLGVGARLAHDIYNVLSESTKNEETNEELKKRAKQYLKDNYGSFPKAIKHISSSPETWAGILAPAGYKAVVGKLPDNSFTRFFSDTLDKAERWGAKKDAQYFGTVEMDNKDIKLTRGMINKAYSEGSDALAELLRASGGNPGTRSGTTKIRYDIGTKDDMKDKLLSLLNKQPKERSTPARTQTPEQIDDDYDDHEGIPRIQEEQPPVRPPPPADNAPYNQTVLDVLEDAGLEINRNTTREQVKQDILNIEYNSLKSLAPQMGISMHNPKREKLVNAIIKKLFRE